MSTLSTEDRSIIVAPRADDGVASTELALLFSLLLVLTLFPIQVALFWHAQQNAALAADLALDVAQAETATAEEAQSFGLQVIASANQLTNPSVVVNRDVGGTDLVTVTVTGDLRYQVIPLGWSVSSVAQGRIEEFVGEDDR